MKTGCFLMFSVLFYAQLITAVTGQAKINETACHWIHDRKCPDPEVRFYLYTRSNVDERQLIHIDATWESSNLSSSYFNPKKPNKIIIHGFRADMFLTPIFEMKTEYLLRDDYNIFYVDWYNLSSSFCYPAVVHNIKHVGECSAQLVERIRDAGGVEIHVIGFSLGAQVTNYIANSLKPDYVLPRITGLDPALPLFVTSNKEHKLDSSDAKFVDVYHCNGLMQGQIERCGSVDFYMNGGIYQPGCGDDIFTCSHHRCPYYFMESIQSSRGFYGWKCQSFFHYVLGLCPFSAGDMLLAGENCKVTSKGMFLVKTNSKSPFAKGNSGFDAKTPRWINDEESIQLEALNVVRNAMENGKFSEDFDDAENEGFASVLEKLNDLNQKSPKVLSTSKT